MNSYRDEKDYRKKRKYYEILFIIFSCMGIMFMILFGYFLLFSNIKNENIQILLILISFLVSCITLTHARGCEENINSLAGEHLIRKKFENMKANDIDEIKKKLEVEKNWESQEYYIIRRFNENCNR